MARKVLSALLAVCLLAAALPVAASAEENVYYEYDCGAAGHLSYRVVTDEGGKFIEIGTPSDEPMDVAGNLTVPASIEVDGEELPVKSIARGAFACGGLTSISLPEGLETIGTAAFNLCYSLQSLTIPASVTSLGEGRFLGVPCVIAVAEGNQKFESLENKFLCEKLPDGGKKMLHCPQSSGDLTIPEGVTKFAQEGVFPEGAEYGAVNFPASLSADAFADRWGNFRGVSIRSAQSWNIPESAEHFISIDGALYTKDKTRLLKYSASKTTFAIEPTVTQIAMGAFSKCSFREADLSGFPIESLPGAAFRGSQLEQITLPETLQFIGAGAFADCVNLRALDLPDSVEELGASFVEGCDNLSELHLSKNITSGLEFFERPAFDPKVQVTIDPENPVYCSDEQGCLYKKENGVPVTLVRTANGTAPITLPETVTAIGDGGFYGCKSIPSITLPDTLERIGIWAFNGCGSLQELTIPAGVTEIADPIPYAFFDTGACGITVEEGNENYFSYEGGLYGADGTLYYIPDRSTVRLSPQTKKIGAEAGRSNTALVSVEIPEGVTEIGREAFRWCGSLRSLVLPDGLKRISQLAFTDTALTEVTLPNSITYMGTRVFENCNALVRVKTADSAAQAVSAQAKLRQAAARSEGEPVDGRLDDVIVANCPELTTLEIPGDVREIAATIYENCPKLDRIYVPAGVSAICEDTFAGLNDLTLYGETGSYAEAFAEAHQIPFVSGKPQDAAPPVKPDPPVSDDPVVETKTTEDGNTVTTTTQANGDKEIEVKTPAGETVANIDLPADPGEGKSFVDVKEGDWFEEAVNSVTAHGLFSGTSETTFTPNGRMTRGMVAKVLHNLSGGAAYGTERNAFQDVKGGIWYEDSVNWAAETGIVFGTSAEKFSPEQSVTREQLVTMLYRYAKLIGADSKSSAGLERFPDAGKVSGYARPAMEWAVKEGLITGRAQKGGDFIAPQGTATRAEVALILTRFTAYLTK